MKGLFIYQAGSICSSRFCDELGRTKEYLKNIGIQTVCYDPGYQAPQMVLIPDDDEKTAEISRLTAEIARLTDERNDSKIEHRGYYAYIQYSAIDKVLHGKIEGIKDLVTFESESATEIENEFHKAVDDYIEIRNKIEEGK